MSIDNNKLMVEGAKMSDDGIFTLKEFYNRGVVKLAPDALVYINGSLTSMVLVPAAVNEGKVSFNSGITNISVSNTMENPGASQASVEITTPIYGSNSAYWIPYPGPTGDDAPSRIPVFIPMMEVKIFFKGRFMVDGSPKYYPAFWGFIVHVEESFSGGAYKISLSCADMLHWWSYSTLNVHPNLESNVVANGQQDLTVFSTIFKDHNPFNIIYTLNNLMTGTANPEKPGELPKLAMSNFITSAWIGSTTPPNNIFPPGTFSNAVLGDILTYWNGRFANTGNLLKMYGLDGQRVDHNGLEIIAPYENKTSTSKDSNILNPLQRRGTAKFKLDNALLKDFVPFLDYSKMGDFSQSEYITKLEIAINVKNRTHYEFFQDVNGNFVFKPPFYNLNVKGIQPYTILPNDIISCSFGKDSEGVVTFVTVTTSFQRGLYAQATGRGTGAHMDVDLTKKYGVRAATLNYDYIISDPDIARSLALGYLATTNAKTVTGTIQIPGRPEMRLGYPIYIEHRDSFHYVKSISHSFDYGGSFTTTLGVETERRKEYIPADDKKSWNPKPLKDYVYRLSSPIYSTPLQTTPGAEPIPSLFAQQNQALDPSISSIQQGGYTLEPRNPNATFDERVVTNTTVPFTDEDGYRVVGSFLYGRGTNALCIDSNTTNVSMLKDIYLTTMARPIYQNESEAMNPLFFDDQEGIVPNFYINPNGEGMPAILGKISDQTTSMPSSETTSGDVKNIVFAAPAIMTAEKNTPPILLSQAAVTK